MRPSHLLAKIRARIIARVCCGGSHPFIRRRWPKRGSLLKSSLAIAAIFLLPCNVWLAAAETPPGTVTLNVEPTKENGQFPFPPKKRNPLVAAISSDGGRTWPHRKLIESDPEGLYHYIAIHFTNDAVLLGYCAGDSKVGALNRLRLRRISLDSLLQK